MHVRECSFCEQNISIYITWGWWLREKESRQGKKKNALRWGSSACVCVSMWTFVIVCAKVNCKMAGTRMRKWPWAKNKRRKNEMTRWNRKNVEFNLDGCPNGKYNWTLFDCAHVYVCGNLQTASAPFISFFHSFSFTFQSILQCLVSPFQFRESQLPRRRLEDTKHNGKLLKIATNSNRNMVAWHKKKGKVPGIERRVSDEKNEVSRRMRIECWTEMKSG